MSFFKNIFGGDKDKTPIHTNFQEGDIIYTSEKDKYHISQILKIEGENTLHIKMFKSVDHLPSVQELDNLKVAIYHSPLSRSGFKNPRLLANKKIEDQDLIGYFEYIKQVNDIDAIVAYAKKFYQEGYELTNANKNDLAIEKYSKAIDLLPNFFEAIDNRAFCKMNLGKWEDAIADFQLSLKTKPNSLLATFSIGECYLRIQNYEKAKAYFEKAVQIDPNHPKPKEFLQATIDLLNQ